MSHSVVVVMARRETDIVTLLEPYDENREVEPYEVECYCKQTRHNKDITANQIEKLGQMWVVANRELYQKYKSLLSASKEEYKIENDKLNKKYQEVDAEFDATYIYSFNPDCDECHGTGIGISTYNPQSRWDWWEFGGRWSDYKPPLARAQVSEERYVPFAILTEADGWQESAMMGWFGITSNDKNEVEWADIYFKTLSKATRKGLKPFVVDIHI